MPYESTYCVSIWSNYKGMSSAGAVMRTKIACFVSNGVNQCGSIMADSASNREATLRGLESGFTYHSQIRNCCPAR